MKVIFHLPRKEMEVPGNKKLADLAKELNLNLEAYLFVRNEAILTRDEWIRDTDTVEIYPVISGG
ncbi:MAG: MoaD/ThiS family protein [Moorellales bacterium]